MRLTKLALKHVNKDWPIFSQGLWEGSEIVGACFRSFMVLIIP